MTRLLVALLSLAVAVPAWGQVAFKTDQGGTLVARKISGGSMVIGKCLKSISATELDLDTCSTGVFIVLDSEGLPLPNASPDTIRADVTLELEECETDQACFSVDSDLYSWSCQDIQDAGGLCLTATGNLSGTLNITTGEITQSGDPFTSGRQLDVSFSYDTSLGRRYINWISEAVEATAAAAEEKLPPCSKIGFVSASTSTTVTGTITLGVAVEGTDSAALLSLATSSGEYDAGGESAGSWTAGQDSTPWVDCDNGGACAGTVTVNASFWCM